MRHMLLYVDASRANLARIAATGDFAKECGAHLEAMYVKPTLAMPILASEAPLSGDFVADEMDRIEARGEQARVEFFKRVDDAIGWTTYNGAVGDAVTEAAKYTDLLVIGQHDPDDGASIGMDVLGEALVHGAAPVLVVPEAATSIDTGGCIAVAWSDTPAAARAVRDALPLLRRAERVEAFTVGELGETSESMQKLARYLGMHGIEVHCQTVTDNGESAGYQLIDFATKVDARLLVMGAYGHSRLREQMLGGATRDVLEVAEIPVLFSH